MKRWIVFLVALALPALCPAAAPAMVGQVDLGAGITQLRVSADGKVAVAFLQPSAELPWGLRVIDTKVPEKPVLRGFIAAERPGHLVLAPDGRLALLLAELEKEAVDTETRHEIVAIDLSNPDAPKPRWRREILARKVVLADDASAFAASRRSKTPEERWQTAITWVSGERPDAVVEEPERSQPDMKFSEGARFLVDSQSNRQLRVFDLGREPPVLHQQGYTEYGRYGCIAAILQNGHILVEDTRFPRLGIYAPEANVPRVAALTHDGDKHCERLDAGTAGSLILAGEIAGGRVYRIDLRDPGQPAFSASWQFPVKTYPHAVAGALAFAAAGELRRQLQVFRLDVAGPTAVDWMALDAAHRAAMDRYNQELQEGKAVPYVRAARDLEWAGIRQALLAPVEGISAQRAAALLNDYGFLASKSGGDFTSAEAALRRAMELDPNRALAALNLADVLRDRVSAVTESSARQRRIAEIQALYSKYLELGGKNNARIEAFMKGQEPRGADGDICTAIARSANAGRLQEWITGSASKIKTGDRRIDIAFTTEGTAHVPTLHAFDSETDFPLEEDAISTPWAEGLWGGDELGLMVYRDTAHILHYRDFRHPVAAWTLSGAQACSFRAYTAERVGPGAVEPELCRSLNQGRGPAAIEFKASAVIDQDIVSERYSETRAGSMRTLDFANDGKPENVLELALSSGAGAACDEMFYDVIDKAGRQLISGSRRDLLMKLENADLTNRHPMPCGNNARFFVYHGKVYFENKPGVWPPADDWNPYHRVARVDRGKVVDVCDFRFETTIALDR